MNNHTVAQTSQTTNPTFVVAPAQTFADEFSAYLTGQELQMQRQPLEACATPAQRRGWLDATHYSSLPEGADPSMWEDERKALYAQHGVTRRGELV